MSQKKAKLKNHQRCDAKTFFWVGTQTNGFQVAEFRCSSRNGHDVTDAHSHMVGNTRIEWNDGVFWAGEMQPYVRVDPKELPEENALVETVTATSSGQKREVLSDVAG